MPERILAGLARTVFEQYPHIITAAQQAQIDTMIANALNTEINEPLKTADIAKQVVRDSRETMINDNRDAVYVFIRYKDNTRKTSAADSDKCLGTLWAIMKDETPAFLFVPAKTPLGNDLDYTPSADRHLPDLSDNTPNREEFADLGNEIGKIIKLVPVTPHEAVLMKQALQTEQPQPAGQ